MIILEKIKHALAEKTGAQDITLETSDNPSFGDYAFPCFSLAKIKRQSPNLLAAALAKDLKIDGIADVKALGPYVNFYVDKSMLLAQTIPAATKEGYGTFPKTGKKIVVEYLSPNTNKPLHLGHLRNIALGYAVSRLCEVVGNKVVEVNLMNDRGVHICKSMVAYKRFGNNKEPDIKSDHFVGNYYVLFNQKSEAHPELEQEAQQMLLAWEKGEKEVIGLWRKMNTWAEHGFLETLTRLNVSFKKHYYESKFYFKGKKVVLDGTKKGFFQRDETGAVFVKLESYGLPDKVLLRGDGTSVYITQDLYLAMLKYKEWKYDESLYVVASEQNMHFQQLFKILDILQFPKANHLHHLSYGMVLLPEGKMKSREGKVVDADELMDDMVNLAKHEIMTRWKDLTHDELEHRAQMIGIGALKFHMLKMDPLKDMVFDPKESISFEGETGPYVQYAHARAASILRKAEMKRFPKPKLENLTAPEELALGKLLAAYPEKVAIAAAEYKPSIIAHYLVIVTQAFNAFYHVCPVLDVKDKELRFARLALVTAVKKVLKNGLALLGIEAPEVM